MRVAINGFGRIGRNFFRAAHARRDDFDIVAVNDLTDTETLAYLLRYDSVLGRFAGDVQIKDHEMNVDGDAFQIFTERDPANLPWGDLGADVVIESHRRVPRPRLGVQAFRGRSEMGHRLGANEGSCRLQPRARRE